jgi:hypothetical protein
MPKGKGYPDQFGLNGTMSAAGKKRLSEQPTSKNNVAGVEVNTIGKRPSASRTVKGMPDKLK